MLALRSEPLLFDIETNGLMPEVDTLHCIVTLGLNSGDIQAYHDDLGISPRSGSLKDGLRALGEAEWVAGHNILSYDIPVLKHLTGLELDQLTCVDTLVYSRLCYSDRKERDFRLLEKGKIEGRYVGQHSLGSWGNRLGAPKGSWDDWSEFSQGMLDYCIQDVKTNKRLLDHLVTQLPTKVYGGRTAAQIETAFAKLLHDQEVRGVRLDKEKGEELLGRLGARRAALLEEIHAAFPPKEIPYKENVRTGKRAVRYCPIREGKFDTKLVPFKPTSRIQLAQRLQEKYGWVPQELSKKTLRPLMHEAILMDLADVYPEAKLAAEYFIVEDRISILEEGPSGYFSLVDSEGILHGRTIHIGTVTHRCSHSQPNTGNVTSIRKPFGKEIRGLFIPHEGYEQAGFDADGLELRMLAHYLGRYDGGKYTGSVLDGSKELGTDPHSRHAQVISTIVPTNRDDGKNTTYAYLYGAGDHKLGKMRGGDRKMGRAIRQAMRTKIDGLGALLQDLERAVAQKGYVTSLDGRRVGIRHAHAALNTLLQAAGAVVMKWVAVYVNEGMLRETGDPTVWLQTGSIHDECQGSLKPGYREVFQRVVAQAFADVTRDLELRCPVSGTAAFGSSWADTH